MATCTGREQLLSRGRRPVADSPDMASCTLYSPVSTSALRVVMPSAPAAMLRALQPGPHLCTQSCYAICARCNAATPGCGETRGRCQSSTPDAGEYVAQMRRHRTHPPHAAANVSRHRPGRTRSRRRTHLHGPAVRKPRRGRSPENRAPVHARGRASGRTQTAGWRSPCGGRRSLWGGGFFLQGSFSGTSKTITSWYKRELKTRALCMVAHKSMHQLDRKIQWRADRLRVQIFSAGSRQGDLKSNFPQKLPDRDEISRKAKIGF